MDFLRRSLHKNVVFIGLEIVCEHWHWLKFRLILEDFNNANFIVFLIFRYGLNFKANTLVLGIHKVIAWVAKNFKIDFVS
jgi:hypothetical protein